MVSRVLNVSILRPHSNSSLGAIWRLSIILSARIPTLLRIKMRYIDNPPNPWSSIQVEWIGEPPEAKLEVYEETATRSIITRNDSPDVGFEYSINCYRGCTHACSYCFSRPTHEYLGFGAGTDFERKIVAKVNAAALLRNE